MLATARWPTRSLQILRVSGLRARSRSTASRTSSPLAHLPLSTSMETISPTWSASTWGRMSRSYISLPRRAIYSLGRVGSLLSFASCVDAGNSRSLMLPPFEGAFIHLEF